MVPLGRNVVSHTIKITVLGLTGVTVSIGTPSLPEDSPSTLVEEKSDVAAIASFSRNKSTITSLPSRPIISSPDYINYAHVEDSMGENTPSEPKRHMAIWGYDHEMNEEGSVVIIQTNLHPETESSQRIGGRFARHSKNRYQPKFYQTNKCGEGYKPKTFDITVGLVSGTEAILVATSTLSVAGIGPETEVKLPLREISRLNRSFLDGESAIRAANEMKVPKNLGLFKRLNKVKMVMSGSTISESFSSSTLARNSPRRRNDSLFGFIKSRSKSSCDRPTDFSNTGVSFKGDPMHRYSVAQDSHLRILLEIIPTKDFEEKIKTKVANAQWRSSRHNDEGETEHGLRNTKKEGPPFPSESLNIVHEVEDENTSNNPITKERENSEVEGSGNLIPADQSVSFFMRENTLGPTNEQRINIMQSELSTIEEKPKMSEENKESRDSNDYFQRKLSESRSTRYDSSSSGIGLNKDELPASLLESVSSTPKVFRAEDKVEFKSDFGRGMKDQQERQGSYYSMDLWNPLWKKEKNGRPQSSQHSAVGDIDPSSMITDTWEPKYRERYSDENKPAIKTTFEMNDLFSYYCSPIAHCMGSQFTHDDGESIASDETPYVSRHMVSYPDPVPITTASLSPTRKDKTPNNNLDTESSKSKGIVKELNIKVTKELETRNDIEPRGLDSKQFAEKADSFNDSSSDVYKIKDDRVGDRIGELIKNDMRGNGEKVRREVKDYASIVSEDIDDDDDRTLRDDYESTYDDQSKYTYDSQSKYTCDSQSKYTYNSKYTNDDQSKYTYDDQSKYTHDSRYDNSAYKESAQLSTSYSTSFDNTTITTFIMDGKRKLRPIKHASMKRKNLRPTTISSFDVASYMDSGDESRSYDLSLVDKRNCSDEESRCVTSSIRNQPSDSGTNDYSCLSETVSYGDDEYDTKRMSSVRRFALNRREGKA